MLPTRKASVCSICEICTSGRRDGITLSNVQVFVTGASEEPVLGFVLHPSIKFV